MKFYDAVGPNPRLVRMFMAEKGIEIPSQNIDIMAGENRAGDYLEKNPFGQMPALELDDGTVLAETTAICQYLEEQNPTPPLFGSTPQERAEALMWTLRVMIGVTEPQSAGFRFAEGLSMFKDRMHCMPEAADDFKTVARKGLAHFDTILADRDYIVGDRFTVADIVLYCLMDFFGGVGQPRDPSQKNIEAWFQRVNGRASAEASLHPIAKGGGMRA